MIFYANALSLQLSLSSIKNLTEYNIFVIFLNIHQKTAASCSLQN